MRAPRRQALLHRLPARWPGRLRTRVWSEARGLLARTRLTRHDRAGESPRRARDLHRDILAPNRNPPIRHPAGAWLPAPTSRGILQRRRTPCSAKGISPPGRCWPRTRPAARPPPPPDGSGPSSPGRTPHSPTARAQKACLVRAAQHEAAAVVVVKADNEYDTELVAMLAEPVMHGHGNCSCSAAGGSTTPQSAPACRAGSGRQQGAVVDRAADVRACCRGVPLRLPGRLAGVAAGGSLPAQFRWAAVRSGDGQPGGRPRACSRAGTASQPLLRELLAGRAARQHRLRAGHRCGFWAATFCTTLACAGPASPRPGTGRLSRVRGHLGDPLPSRHAAALRPLRRPSRCRVAERKAVAVADGQPGPPESRPRRPTGALGTRSVIPAWRRVRRRAA